MGVSNETKNHFATICAIDLKCPYWRNGAKIKTKRRYPPTQKGWENLEDALSAKKYSVYLVGDLAERSRAPISYFREIHLCRTSSFINAILVSCATCYTDHGAAR